MPSIAENIRSVRLQIPSGVKLVAVSKTKPVKDILEAYNADQRLFGENRVQELVLKKDLLPSDINWHLIGHLQTNKVKSVVPFVGMIESVDSFRLLTIIDSEALKAGLIVSCLLQIHIAEEETKFGFSMPEITEMLDGEAFYKLKNVRICGVMGMATYIDNYNQVRKEFRYLASCFNEIKLRYFRDDAYFCEKSMGMSGDYLIAIEEGSTIVRIGSLIFGERN